MPANRPHFHIWKAAKPRKDGKPSTAWFRATKGFHTAQAASQWMRRRESNKSKWMVLKCEHDDCKPPLD